MSKNIKENEGIKFEIRHARLDNKKETEIKPQRVDYVKEQAKKHFEEIFNRR